MLRKIKFTPLVFICILATQALITPIAAYAQDANPTATDTVAGSEISSEAFNDYYYWDIENKNGEDRAVIYAKGGKYTETIKFEEKEPGVFIPASDTLPVNVIVPEDETNTLCGEGIPLDMKDDKPTNMELRISNDAKTVAIDLIGDDGDGDDTFEFSWYSTVDVSDPENPKFIDRSTNNAAGWVNRKLDAISSALSIGSVVKVDLEEDIYTCSYIFKDNFNIFIPPYSPYDTVNGDTFEGKLLGKKGMKFTDWLRQINNIRDYLALAKSAAYETVTFCNQFDNSDNCNNRIADIFHRCYVRAIGIKNTSDTNFMNNDESFMANDVIDDYIKSPDTSASIWNHTIRANLSPFASCYGGNRYSANDRLDAAFSSSQEGIEFGERIVQTTIFPSPIFPIDVDEVDNAAIAREKADTKCSLGKMGWLLCPVITVLSSITDKLFSLIQQWLVVPPILAGEDKAAFVAWKLMRDVANVLFVIFLIVVVISQITGGTTTAYALRKIVPRLIVTALLINLSFYLCSLALDISNVMGSSLYNVLRGLAPPGSPVSEFNTWEAVSSSIVLAGGATALATAGVLAGLAALVPMLITAFISMIVVLLTLLLRQSLIIILIIVSPLAFALKLLPGTNTWYQKWQTIFTQMLFLYPTIAIVFAGAYFASNVVSGQAAAQGNAILAIFAMAIQIIPLFITPIIMKFGGGALNSFGGMIKGGIKAPADKINKASKQMQEDRNLVKNTRAAYGSRTPAALLRRRKIRRDYKRSKREGELDRSRKHAVSGSSALKTIAGVAGGGFNKGARSDIKSELDNELKKLASQDTQVARVHIKDSLQSQNFTDEDAVNNELLAIFDTGNEAQRTAAIQEIVQGGNLDTIHSLVARLNKTTGTGGTKRERETLSSAIASSNLGSSAAHLTTKEGQKAIEDGTATVGSLYQQAYAAGKYNAATMANQSPESIAGMGEHFSDAQISHVTNKYFEAANNPRTAQNISPASTEALERIQPSRRTRP